MNVTTITPVQDANGTTNNNGFEWGLSNPSLSLLKTAIGNNEMTYHIPRLSYIKPPAITISVDTFATSPQAYSGGVLAPNGKIYFVPNTDASVLEYDPLTGNTFSFGSLGTASNKWVGGCLAPNGNIYCAPRNSATILEIVPDSRVVNTYTYAGFPLSGAICGNDGKVYFLPYTTTNGNFAEFDPYSKLVNYYGDLGASSPLFNAGVLAPNGFIYCIPSSANVFAKIDTNAKTIKTFNTVASGASTFRYSCGVLVPNGKIYCVPYGGEEILVIDTLTDTTYNFGSLSASTSKWGGGFLGPDGNIWCVPYSARNGTTGVAQILKINWLYDTYEIIEIDSSIVAAGQSAMFTGALLTQFGKGIGIPTANEGALVIDFNMPINPDVVLSNTLNKL